MPKVPHLILIKLLNVILLIASMGDDITYLDLLVLKKMDSESTVEKFGMKINTSFFDTANMLGSMKIKGLLEIQSSIGGQSPITITGEGKDLISSAIQKAGEPIDTLDQTILNALVSGIRDLTALQKVINIRAKDLAFHLYKLKSYDYIDQTVQSARVNFSLTEKGFLLTKGYRSSIKASEVANKSTSTPTQPASDSASEKKEIKKSGTIEDEIRDLFNFKSYNKTKDYKRPEEQKPNVTPSKQTPDSPSADSTVPPFLRKAPVKKGMDRQKMLMSKLDFYIQRYAIFAVLILIMLVLIVFAVVFALLS